ncbi:putative ribonuclease H-like domain-containing protein [Tanacetum coccineum]
MSQPANDDYSQHLSDDEASYHEDAFIQLVSDNFFHSRKPMVRKYHMSDANQQWQFLRSLPPAWVFEQELTSTSKSSASAQNVAFVSHSKSSTNKVKSGHTGAYSTYTPTSSNNIQEREVPAGFADEVIYSLFAKQSEDLDLLHEDLEQMMMKFYKKTGRRVRIDGNKPVGFDKKKLECFKCHNTGHFARECPSKGTNDVKEKKTPIINIKAAGKKEAESEQFLTMDDGVGPQKHEISDSDHNSTEHSTCQSNESERSYGNTSEHSSESEISRVPQEVYVSKPITTNEKGVSTPKSKEVEPRELGEGYSFTKKKCFVCGSLSHLIKDYDYYEKKMAREAEFKKQRVFNTGNRVEKPVWTNANRVNHANQSVPKLDHLLKNMEDKGIFDSGCSGHMTGNKDHLDDFKECKGRSVTFRGSKGYITGKGTLQSPNANASEEADEDEELIVVPTTIKHSATKVRPRKSYTPEILAFRRDLDQLAQKHLWEVNTDKATSTNSVNSGRKPGMVHDFNNLPTKVAVSPIHTLRIHNIHPQSQILGDPKSSVQTRSRVKQTSGAHALEEPKKISEALKDDSWVEAMQEELLYWVEDMLEEVVTVLAANVGSKLIYLMSYRGLEQKWVYKNKWDERGVVVRNKEKIIGAKERQEGYHAGSWYVDDIIFALLEKLVKQKTDGIFISQDKYVADMLKMFDLASVKTAITPMETKMALTKDEEADDVDVHLYRSMIGSLMYLTASRPDIMRIFKYLKGKPNLGLWYPRESSFDLEAFLDSDYAGANLDRKSITGGCQFLRSRLISWQCKKQTIVATSTTKAEYVAAAKLCGKCIIKTTAAVIMKLVKEAQKLETRGKGLRRGPVAGTFENWETSDIIWLGGGWGEVWVEQTVVSGHSLIERRGDEEEVEREVGGEGGNDRAEVFEQLWRGGLLGGELDEVEGLGNAGEDWAWGRGAVRCVKGLLEGGGGRVGYYGMSWEAGGQCSFRVRVWGKKRIEGKGVGDLEEEEKFAKKRGGLFGDDEDREGKIVVDEEGGGVEVVADFADSGWRGDCLLYGVGGHGIRGGISGVVSGVFLIDEDETGWGVEMGRFMVKGVGGGCGGVGVGDSEGKGEACNENKVGHGGLG